MRTGGGGIDFVVVAVMTAIVLCMLIFIGTGVKRGANQHFEKTADDEYIKTEIGPITIDKINYFVEQTRHVKGSSYSDQVQIYVGEESYNVDIGDLRLIPTDGGEMTLFRVDVNFKKGDRSQSRFDRYEVTLTNEEYKKLKKKETNQLGND